MGQVLHGSARTTAAVRRAIQHSQGSLRSLAKRHGINQKTVAKWKKRTSAADQRTGPKAPHSTVLSTEEEAIVVAFRRHTLLPLDDCLWGLQPMIPQLTRSSLHRCLERHGISRLPEVEGDKAPKKRFASYPLATFTSTLPRSARRRASSACSSLSIARANLPSRNSCRARARWKPHSSYAS